MAKLRGTNALCYIGGTKVPNANEWTIDIEQEKIEAPHTFVCPTSAASQWVERSGGFFSGSFTISALYDDTDDDPITAALSDTVQEVLLYPSCDATTKYFTANFWVQISVNTNVDEYVGLDVSGDSDGQVTWAPDA
jgi:hypothetical protein